MPPDGRRYSAPNSHGRCGFGLVAGLVLLICCRTLRTLFAARSAAREREMAMRAAIGASRGRLVQQVLRKGAPRGGRVRVRSRSCVVRCAGNGQPPRAD